MKTVDPQRIKLQVFYILIQVFNILYYLLFPRILRRLLQRIAGYRVGKGTSIHAVRFFSFGKLKIGANTIINPHCYLDNRRGIIIGNHVVIAQDCKIYTLGHDINDVFFRTKGAQVTIEDYVVIFSNALIMPGVTLKKGSVVLPGSVVTKNVDEMTVVGGNPAVPLKKREVLHAKKKVLNYWFPI